MSHFTVTIKGSAVKVEPMSLSYEDGINERSIARFRVNDTAGSASYTKGDPVEIRDGNGDMVFSGFVESSVERRIGFSTAIRHDITASDPHYLADKRIVAESYTDTASGGIVRDLWTKYLKDEGVRLHDYETVIKADTPLGYWRLGETSGDTFADSSGNGYDASRPSGAIPVDGGLFGDTDGGTRASNGATATGLPQTVDEFTVEFWIRQNDEASADNYESFWGRYPASGYTPRIQVQRATTNPSLYMRLDTSGGTNQTFGVIGALDGEWHHVCYTVDRGTAKAFLDGVRKQTYTYAHGNGFDTGSTSVSVVQGEEERDEVAYYARALTEAEVAHHYEVGLQERATTDTEGQEVDDGPTVGTAIFSYTSATSAIEELAERADFHWVIDRNRLLHFRERGAVTAPWNLTDDDHLLGQTELTNGNPSYRNRQYVRGGQDVTSQQTESFSGDGEARVFTVSYPFAHVPTVTLNGASQTVGIKGLQTGKQWYWNKGDSILTHDSSEPVLTSSDTLEVTYKGLYDLVVMAEVPSDIEDRAAVEGIGTGIVEHAANEANISDRAHAFDKAKAKLKRYGTIGRVLRFETRRTGLAAGQLLTISTATPHDLDGAQMLITNVEARDRGDHLVYTVRAIEGPVTETWTDFFAKGLGDGDTVDFVKVGSGEVLARLVAPQEEYAWTEAVTKTVVACPLPSSSTYPSSSLYPC